MPAMAVLTSCSSRDASAQSKHGRETAQVWEINRPGAEDQQITEQLADHAETRPPDVKTGDREAPEATWSRLDHRLALETRFYLDSCVSMSHDPSSHVLHSTG